MFKEKLNAVKIMEVAIDDALNQGCRQFYDVLVEQGWTPPPNDNELTEHWADPVC